MVGSKRRNIENEDLVIPELKWYRRVPIGLQQKLKQQYYRLGVHLSDCDQMPVSVFAPLTPLDVKKGKELLDLSFIQSRQLWR